MTKVKICGITRLDDAVAALLAGADYLGFILYPPSPRAIAPNALFTLTRRLRQLHLTRLLFKSRTPPLLIGVFVNESGRKIAETMKECGLDLAQLSGEEESGMLTDPGSMIYGRGYKALRPRSVAEAKQNAQTFTHFPTSPERPQLLLDTPHGNLFGGSGETGDWAIARDIATIIPGLMLAGGLTPDNVADAVRQVRPFAVDVASGVETSPGIKDHNLIREFITQAKTPTYDAPN